MSNGTTHLRPTPGSQITERDIAFGSQAGRQFAGLLDLTALDAESLTKKGRKILEESGRESFSIDELRSLGLEPKMFTRAARKDLKRAGLLEKRGRLAAQSQLEEFVAGPFGERGGEIREQLADIEQQTMDLVLGGLDTAEAGLEIARGDFESPAARAIVQRQLERIGGGLAARGLSRAGEGALLSSAAVMESLLGFGGDLVNLGFGTAAQARQERFAFDPFTDPAFALGREDIRYSRQLADFLFDFQRQEQHRARERLDTGTLGEVSQFTGELSNVAQDFTSIVRGFQPGADFVTDFITQSRSGGLPGDVRGRRRD